MKKVIAIALSIFSVTAFASDSNGLSPELIEQATHAGISSEQAVKAVASGQINHGMTAEQMLEVTK